MNLQKILIKISLLPVIIFLFIGWGRTGHQLINKNCVDYFPKEFSWYSKWENDLINHASDADSRKSQYPDEGIKHYIDIDNYPEFVSTGKISQSLDSMIDRHGYNFVYEQGILPWATLTTYDSLVSTFKRKDWAKSVLFAADLGHYVGDGFMPLHVTANYNPGGIHSKFESTLINKYSNQITFSVDSSNYISNIEDSIFSYIYFNNGLVDSIINASNYAKSLAGSTSSDLYYSYLWQKSYNFTSGLFNDASKTLAAFIYTAWVDAGKPAEGTTDINGEILPVVQFNLNQNYPNPFNPSTTISYSLAFTGHVQLKVFDLLGKEIITLVDENKLPGSYMENYDATANDGKSLSSGIYFYRINIVYDENGIDKLFSQTKKLILVK